MQRNRLMRWTTVITLQGLLAGVSACTGGPIVGAPCLDELSACPDGCYDLLTDPYNCGGCGNVCGSGLTCAAGQCVDCVPGTPECDTDSDPITPGDGGTYGLDCPDPLVPCDGECVDLLVDPLHCGGCDIECADDESCEQGQCLPLCDDGLIPCGEECVDPLIDTNNCGDCGNECGDDELCSDGYCVPDCSPLEWCGDGCVYLGSDLDHCGECDNACDEGWYCVAGECDDECPSPYVACGDVCVDVMSDPFHCGHCNLACDSGVCVNGSCSE
jgi:hypothetical protein